MHCVNIRGSIGACIDCELVAVKMAVLQVTVELDGRGGSSHHRRRSSMEDVVGRLSDGEVKSRIEEDAVGLVEAVELQ